MKRRKKCKCLLKQLKIYWQGSRRVQCRWKKIKVVGSTLGNGLQIYLMGKGKCGCPMEVATQGHGSRVWHMGKVLWYKWTMMVDPITTAPGLITKNMATAWSHSLMAAVTKETIKTIWSMAKASKFLETNQSTKAIFSMTRDLAMVSLSLVRMARDMKVSGFVTRCMELAN